MPDLDIKSTIQADSYVLKPVLRTSISRRRPIKLTILSLFVLIEESALYEVCLKTYLDTAYADHSVPVFDPPTKFQKQVSRLLNLDLD